MTQLPPVMRKLTDLAMILGVVAAIALVMIVCANSLVSKATLWHSYVMWVNFISRPDIVVTTLLAVIVSLAFTNFQQGRVRR